MFPKEHGAYGQLLFPLITSLIVGRRTPSALMLAAAALLAFLAHEPLLVLLGQRGPRAARDQRSRAIVWFASTSAGAALVGAAALVRLPPRIDVTIPLIVSVSLAALLAIVILVRREHTLAGEILAALLFSSLALPVARAAGAATMVAVTCAAVFAAVFVAATVCVHAVIARSRHPPAAVARAAGAVVALASIAALSWLASADIVSSISPLAALPACAAACGAAIAAPRAKYLRAIGWTLIVTTAMGAALLILVLG